MAGQSTIPRKGSFYIKQLPSCIEITPMGERNTEKQSIQVTYEEYTELIEWLENDSRPLEQVLSFLTPLQQQLINGNIVTHIIDSKEEVYA